MALNPDGTRYEPPADPHRQTPPPNNNPNWATKPINPDRPVWEKQPHEPARAYKAFAAYRDGEDRVVRRLEDEHGIAVRKWSSVWSWAFRAYEYDRFMAAKELDDAIRFRRAMNSRQRKAASLAQSKIVNWLIALDPSTLSPGEAARWFEVACKVERMANGGDAAQVQVSGNLAIQSMTAEEIDAELAHVQDEIGSLLVRADDDST